MKEGHLKDGVVFEKLGATAQAFDLLEAIDDITGKKYNLLPDV